MPTEPKWPPCVKSVQYKHGMYRLTLAVGETVVVYGVNGNTRIVADKLDYDQSVSFINEDHLATILAAVAEANL